MTDEFLLPPELRLTYPNGIDHLRIADHLAITLGQKAIPVGQLRVRHLGGEVASEFRHSASWLTNGKFFPVSPELRKASSGQWRRRPEAEGRNFFAALSDTQPTGFALSVIQRAQACGLLDAFRPHGDDPSCMDTLCAVPDICRLGALRIHPLGESVSDVGVGMRRLPVYTDLVRLSRAVAAFERKEENLSQLLQLLFSATALGGSRPKCTWIQKDGQLAVARFPSIHDPCDINRAEVLTARLARAAGINVVDVKLAHPVFDPFALSLRFDRGPDGGRQPFLSARSLLLAEDDDAIEHFELLEAMRVCCKDFEADAQQLWSRLLFGLLIGHQGFNLHKIGFLYAGKGQWRLAPAYGLRPAGLRSETTQAGELACRTPSITLDALMEGSEAFAVSRSAAEERLSQQLSVIRDWKKLATEFSINMNDKEMQVLEKRSRIVRIHLDDLENSPRGIYPMLESAFGEGN